MDAITPVKFNNPEVDAKYVSLIAVDKEIRKPGEYSGKLSGITPEMAKGMVERGSNLIAAKETATPDPVKADKKADPVKDAKATEEIKT